MSPYWILWSFKKAIQVWKLVKIVRWTWTSWKTGSKIVKSGRNSCKMWVVATFRVCCVAIISGLVTETHAIWWIIRSMFLCIRLQHAKRSRISRIFHQKLKSNIECSTWIIQHHSNLIMTSTDSTEFTLVYAFQNDAVKVMRTQFQRKYLTHLHSRTTQFTERWNFSNRKTLNFVETSSRTLS